MATLHLTTKGEVALVVNLIFLSTPHDIVKKIYSRLSWEKPMTSETEIDLKEKLKEKEKETVAG